MPAQIREMPEDFAEVALTMTRHDLAVHYKTSNRKIQKWFRELGLHTRYGKGLPAWNRRPVPEGYAELAPKMSGNQLGQHFGTSYTVVMRWAEETGIYPRAYEPNANSASRMGQSHKVGLSSTNKTIYDCAADTLRRERFHVHRCNERGAFDLKGQYWRCGYSVLTDEELLVRAAKYERSAA